jgi:hypothetical protein
MFKVQWLAMVPAIAGLGCAPHYYHVGLPVGAPVGQKGAVLNDGIDLKPCATVGDTQGQCVYYVNECDETGLHTITIQRLKKGIRVRAYCEVPNAVVPPVTSALVIPSPEVAPATAETTSSDPGPL